MRSELTPMEVIVNRILIVESDREQADSLQSLLQGWRYQTEVARDAGQARAAFNMHLPDFVILEAILPNDVSGFELCERLKRENDGVPVMMLTEIDMDDARSLASRVGVDSYLTKPAVPDRLKEEIRTVAERVWARKHLGHDEGAGEDKIRFSCTECGKHLKAKLSHRGKTLNCPRCGQTVIVPLYV